MVVAGAFVVLLGTACGSSRVVVQQHSTSTVAPAEVAAASVTANRQRTQAEVERLARLVAVPPGSVKVTSASPSVLTGPVMGTPATTSLIDDHTFWRVPLGMSATLGWFGAHPPGGLTKSGSGSSSSHGVTTMSGYGYGAPSSSAWTDASVEIGVAPMGPSTSLVRADAVAAWIDPVPVRDVQSGPRMRVAVATGCPATDQGFVGVTNPPPALATSLLPTGTPIGGLGCQYSGSNGRPFELERKTTLDPAAARAFAQQVRRLALGHLDGQVTHCPADLGDVTVVALAYPNGQDVDLWMATTGCEAVSNGYIRAAGSVPL